MAGFLESINSSISVLLNIIFGWAIPISPYFAIFLVTFVMTFLSTVIYKYTSDQVRLKEIKREMDSIKARMKEAKGDMSKVSELNKKLTALSMETMKHSLFNFKYMIISLIPLALIFTWAKDIFAPMNLWNSTWGWFWVYLIFSLIISQIVRKVLKVY